MGYTQGHQKPNLRTKKKLWLKGISIKKGSKVNFSYVFLFSKKVIFNIKDVFRIIGRKK